MKAQGNMCVMCCGCRRFLAEDGKAISQPVGGVVEISRLFQAASAKELDEFAAAHGWQVRDQHGPNHRCPDCKSVVWREPPSEAQRGAYVRIEDL